MDKNYTGSNLSLCYGEDFEDFESGVFKQAYKDTQRDLRDFLQLRRNCPGQKVIKRLQRPSILQTRKLQYQSHILYL